MKTLLAAVALTTALNSSIASSAAFASIQTTSEPVALAAWGLVLFLIASGVKRRTSPAADAVPVPSEARASSRAVARRRDSRPQTRDSVALEGRRLEAHS